METFEFEINTPSPSKPGCNCLKFVPETTKLPVEPATPLAGESAVMVGFSGRTVKNEFETAVPDAVVIAIRPSTAPLGTQAVMFVSLATE